MSNTKFPQVGDVFTGAVVSTVPFGSFVSHPCGAEGLLHGTQAAVGAQVTVTVLQTDPANSRFSLALA